MIFISSHQKDKTTMEKIKKTRQSPYFPQEIIQEILSRLHVKTLMRFKTVCKSWHSLISDSHFFKFHLNQSINQNRTMFMFLHDSQCSQTYVVPNDTSKTSNKNQLDESNKGVDFLASCDGLFCISDVEDDLYLWNPSTRVFKKLPSPPIDFPEDSCSCASVFYGLGHDSCSDDYKLVRVAMFDSIDFRTEVRIYSRNNNTWKRIGDFPYDFPHGGSGVFVSGCIHWMVSLWNDSVRYYMVAAIDIANESYGLIQLPRLDHEKSYFDIGALDENLVLFCCMVDFTLDMWILKEYGEVESWKRINIIVPYITKIEAFLYFKPLCVWKPGKILLRVGAKRILMYDVKKKMCRDIFIPDMFKEYRIVSFVESLVAPY